MPTCQGIRVLICCACLLTSLSYAHALTNPTYHPTESKNAPQFDPLRPTGTQNWSTGTNTGVTGPQGDGPSKKTDLRAGAGKALRPTTRQTHIENLQERETILARSSNCVQSIEHMLGNQQMTHDTTTTPQRTHGNSNGRIQRLRVAKKTQWGSNEGLPKTDRSTHQQNNRDTGITQIESEPKDNECQRHSQTIR